MRKERPPTVDSEMAFFVAKGGCTIERRNAGTGSAGGRASGGFLSAWRNDRRDSPLRKNKEDRGQGASLHSRVHLTPPATTPGVHPLISSHVSVNPAKDPLQLGRGYRKIHDAPISTTDRLGTSIPI